MPGPQRTAGIAARRSDQLTSARGAGPRERLGRRYLLAVGVTLVVAAVVLTVGALESIHRADQLRAYQRADAALATLALPVSIHRYVSPGLCPEPLCGRSRLSPSQVTPVLRRLLHGSVNPALSGPSCGVGCPVAVYGTIDGARVVGIAFWHRVFVDRGSAPPQGAIAVPNARGRVFYLGSDIDIGAIQPPWIES